MHHAADPIGRSYPRGRFTDRQLQAFARDGKVCPITGLPMYLSCGHHQIKKRACHHLWPEKWVRTFCKGADPHILENLLTIHPSLHAKCTAAERFLYAGNLLSFKQEMIRLGYDWALFERALSALTASAKARYSQTAKS